MTQPKSHNENPRRRTTTRLSATLDKGLVAYVAAAGAGMLAAQPAQGEVVYTPANTPIAVNTPLALDLNNDGIADFVLSNNSVAGWARPESCYTHCSYRRHESLKVSPAQAGNAIWGIASSLLARPTRLQKKIKRSTNKEVAAPLFWGVDAGSGPGRNFRPQTVMMDSNIYTWSFPGRFIHQNIRSLGQRPADRRALSGIQVHGRRRNTLRLGARRGSGYPTIDHCHVDGLRLRDHPQSGNSYRLHPRNAGRQRGS